jgi:hypothetical protein
MVVNSAVRATFVSQKYRLGLGAQLNGHVNPSERTIRKGFRSLRTTEPDATFHD